MKIYLDDCRQCPEGWTLAKTAQEAIDLLLENKDIVTHISLDHDLGPEEAGTGYDVACWIEERYYTDADWIAPQWAIHSSNPVGRQRMSAALRRLQQFKW